MSDTYMIRIWKIKWVWY